ncbi:MAG: C69 family dipeptidase [Bacilli bacterium]|nr:C69 family dipeptidase [Bacilli bacterium]
MPCTTILVGKKASNDGSTLVARNDDSPSGVFHVKKMVLVKSEQQMKIYKSALSDNEIPLPLDPLPYTAMPNVDLKEGIWAAAGINSKNVAMSATETITSNERVLGADPLIAYDEEKKKYKGGIGEEDFVVLVLPYIHSAREGVLRLGQLLETYGTYESNGIAFQDKDEIWWLETIGGHHYIAKRVPDDQVVIMPNQFGLDHFDFEDAYGEGKENLCSKDLKEFVEKYHLNLQHDCEDEFNPRLSFGSHTDSDHVYNTPRAWFMGRYLCPRSLRWEGENRDFSPEDNDIPFSLLPERKIAVEDVKYLLSSHYQGTPYDPYGRDNPEKGKYRCIGVNRTSFLACTQIRGDVDERISAIEWIAFSSNVYNAFVPVFTNTEIIPEYYSNTTMKVDTNNFYWANRLIAALSDAHFNFNSIHIERYQNAVANQSYQYINELEASFKEGKGSQEEIDKINQKIADMAKEETDKVLNKVLYETSLHMKNAFARSDN